MNDYGVNTQKVILAALLGAVLGLPPVKRAIIRSQLGSRYIDRLIERNA
jgi:hypothetical protein